MRTYGWVQERKRVEGEVRRGAPDGMLAELQRAIAQPRTVNGWDAVWRVVDGLPTNDRRFGSAVAAVVDWMAKSDSQETRAALLRLYWPKLTALADRRWRWDDDRDELWQNLVLCLFVSLGRLRCPAHSPSFARKLLNDTGRRLYRLYRVRWRVQHFEVLTDPLFLIDADWVQSDPEITRFELERAQSHEIDRLLEHRRAGRLTDTDELILRATRIYGLPLRKLATESGLSYERLKKRRQRIEQKLRRASRFVVPAQVKRGPLND